VLVCHCMAVYDDQIRVEIDKGARDVFDLADACDAGTVCGGCVPVLCELVGQRAVPNVVPIPTAQLRA
jgi:bacterioferritin-associated ferredoxin